MEKRKRGGQPGNRNAVGHGAPKGNKNAVGHGAPRGNRNAEKHGRYSRKHSDTLEQIICRIFESLGIAGGREDDE